MQPDTIYLNVCDKTDEILGFSNFTVEQIPVLEDSMKFLFANPINFQLFKQLGVFDNCFNLPSGSKVIYTHISVIRDDQLGAGRVWMREWFDRITEKEASAVAMFGMAINASSHNIRNHIWDHGRIWNKVEYKDLVMPDGSRPLASLVRPGFEFAYLQGTYYKQWIENPPAGWFQDEKKIYKKL